MLEPLLKGLVLWLYELFLDLVSYVSNELLTLMSLDLSYFETHVPVVSEIVNIFIAVGWALLLGNLIFQTLKTMFSGLGFEGEDPKTLVIRTFIFGFLLLCSRQVCDIGLSMASQVMSMLALPTNIDIVTIEESAFSGTGSAGWLLVVIMGFIMAFQIIKLLFEIGERYVVVGVLTFLSPLAFAMGNAKATHDIFKGWVRMFASMMLMMVLNLVFLKMIISAMATVPSGAGIIAWMVFIVAIARVARKIDNHIGKIGLNPANTGDGLRSGLPGMLTYAVARTVASTVAKNAVSGKSGKSGGANGTPNPNMPNNSGSGNGSSPVPSGQGQGGNGQSQNSNGQGQNGNGQNAPPISRNTQNNNNSTIGGQQNNSANSNNNNSNTQNGQQNNSGSATNNNNINQQNSNKQNQQGKNGPEPVKPPNNHTRANSGKPPIPRMINKGSNSGNNQQNNKNIVGQQNNMGQNNKNKPVLHGNQGGKPNNMSGNNSFNSNNNNQKSVLQSGGNNQKFTAQNGQNNTTNQNAKVSPVSKGQQGGNKNSVVNNTNNSSGQNPNMSTQHNSKTPPVSPAKQKTVGDNNGINNTKNQTPSLVNATNGQNIRPLNGQAPSAPNRQQNVKSNAGNNNFNNNNTHNSNMKNQGNIANNSNNQPVLQRNQGSGGNNIPSHKNVSGQIPTNNNRSGNLHDSGKANQQNALKVNKTTGNITANNQKVSQNGKIQKVTPQGNTGARPQKAANNNRNIAPISPPNIRRNRGDNN